MARLLSYLYPITKKIESDINGTLELTWHNGK
ncbi:MAG TPA: spermine synthase, partial [Xanthomarina gelatinilytica]|nr:spermine synthase [Xanthomarina gelatinilytica]